MLASVLAPLYGEESRGPQRLGPWPGLSAASHTLHFLLLGSRPWGHQLLGKVKAGGLVEDRAGRPQGLLEAEPVDNWVARGNPRPQEQRNWGILGDSSGGLINIPEATSTGQLSSQHLPSHQPVQQAAPGPGHALCAPGLGSCLL